MSEPTISPMESAWAPVARSAREALALLGYVIEPRCLPDEPGACGGSFADHCVAYFGALKAVSDHQLTHIAPPAVMVEAAYLTVRTELETCGTPDLEDPSLPRRI
jgi:hypothetical protein